MKKIITFILVINYGFFSQVELVPIDHKIYSFLNSLHKKGIINNYNNANLPLSRYQIANYIKLIDQSKSKLSTSEKNILNDLFIEFNYDLTKSLSKEISIFNDFSYKNLFDNSKQKYLYTFADSNASLFFDGTAFISHRLYNIERLDNSYIGLGEYGIRTRGTLHNTIGYFLRISSGQQINGDDFSRQIAIKYDPALSSTLKFLTEKYFESFEGYLRYENEKKGFAITLGREAISMGTGYIDKLMISNNAVPFDFAKIDIGYKNLNYTALYGNLRGFYPGGVLDSKNIIAHRLDISFKNNLKFGIFETVIVPEKPLSFTFMNPLSFLFSADLSSQNDNSSNSMIGIDGELIPAKNIGLQVSFLIDDFDFKYLGKDTPFSNNNRFAWQFGLFNSNLLGINDLNMAIEYTHLDPFFYSHKSNKSQYTHWGLPIGHALRPNSDEIAIKLDYFISRRLYSTFKFHFQRTGEGLIYNNEGKLIRNYGAYINEGEGLYFAKAYFLDGNRINNIIITLSIRFEPIRQFFFDFKYLGYFVNEKYKSQNYSDHIFYFTLSTDL